MASHSVYELPIHNSLLYESDGANVELRTPI